MLLTVVSYLPVVICLYGIGAVILMKDWRRPTNLRFALFTFALASWLMALFVADFSLKLTPALWALRTASVFGTLIGPLFLLFCASFPFASGHKGATLARWYLVPAAFFIAISYSPLIVPAIEIRDNSAQIVNAGLLYSVQSLYIVLGFLLGIIILFGKLRYKSIAPRQRSQILLVIAGITTAVIINVITNVVLILLNQGNKYSNIISTLSFLVFVCATAYAIVKHQLFDMRLAIVRTIGFVLTVGFVTGLYSLLIIGLGAPFVTGGSVSLFKNAQDLLLLIPPTIFIALTFSGIKNLIARATRRVFYHDSYDLRVTLDTLSDMLLAEIEIDGIVGRSLEVISGAIKPSQAYFAVFDEQGSVSHQLALNRKPLHHIKGIIQAAHEFPAGPIIRDAIYDREVPAVFEAEDVALLLLLGGHEKPSGLIMFGPKQNGRIYTSSDIDLLRIGAKNLEIALENAKKYEQINRFADTLREEVNHATTKLRRANARLKSLDVLKNDFMSMASHQLRSPATSVHEALHMLNHPALSDKDREELINLAEANSERLVTVVKTMLNMARLQAGRFTIDRSEENLTYLAEKVIMQTGVVAEQRQTKLKFIKPPKPVVALVDTAKITEAMANYVENAIKYSPKDSTVEVELRVANGRIAFEVRDQGMGVPVSERDHLFGKFYRATNARQEEPDGNGIGLFVVRSIAHGHGGDAYYKPLKKGSLFGFWIPLKRSVES